MITLFLLNTTLTSHTNHMFVVRVVKETYTSTFLQYNYAFKSCPCVMFMSEYIVVFRGKLFTFSGQWCGKIDYWPCVGRHFLFTSHAKCCIASCVPVMNSLCSSTRHFSYIRCLPEGSLRRRPKHVFFFS